MATRANESSKILVRVVTGTTAAGVNTLASRIMSHLNPATTDAVVLSLGTKLGDMQDLTVDSIARQDAATITA